MLGAFLHSFTTGATVDGPGVRVVAWTAGCMWRRGWDSNPRALADKTLSRRPRYDHFGTSPL